MDKLGIGYIKLSAINPLLIYCAISGFGQTGPARIGAGYDGKIQALSGIMSITGHPETGPTRAGFAVCDVLPARPRHSLSPARCSSAPTPARAR
jgi:Predicted acyl-CoA transferases/carnitine dehydratase